MMRNNSVQVFEGGWDEIESAVFTDNQIISPVVTIRAIYVKPDGTELFIQGMGVIETYPLSIPYDVTTLGPIKNTFVITTPLSLGFYLKDDGTRLYIFDVAFMRIFEFILPIPWDTSSITDTPVSLDVSTLAPSTTGITFSRDGDFVFLNSAVIIFRLPLLIPWDITSVVSSTSIPSPATSNFIFFKTEGDKIYLGDTSLGLIEEFDLTTPWDLSTIVSTGNILSLNILPGSAFFRSGGRELFLTGGVPTNIFKYYLNEAWTITSASHFKNEFIIILAPVPRAIVWKPDGMKFMLLNLGIIEGVVEYAVSDPWNIIDAARITNFSLAFLDNSMTGMYWSTDGTRCYVVGLDSNTIFQLNVSTPWDVSTMSDSGVSFNISGQSLQTTGLYFRSDGKKFWVADQDMDEVFEYDMSTPWDLSTASYASNSVDVSLSIQDISGIFFRPDGKRLYIGDRTGGIVARFNLSVPWDVSTITFQDEIDISNTQMELRGIFIREYDGEKLYLVGTDDEKIFSFDMSLEFNNSIITELGDEIITDEGDLIIYA